TAPTFGLGIAPAGGLYTTVNDLGRFLRVLFAGGSSVLKKKKLAEMWKPPFAKEGTPAHFGPRVIVWGLDGHRRIGHNGAVYGFATELAALPEEKLGVAVVAAKDCANAVTERIANIALKHMLAVRAGEPLPKLPETKALDRETALQLAGAY